MRLNLHIQGQLEQMQEKIQELQSGWKEAIVEMYMWMTGHYRFPVILRA